MSTDANIQTIACKPYDDQRPGTAGLRKKVTVFQQPHYLETFLEAIFRTVAIEPGASLVVGGDGRYLNSESIQVIARMAAAHGVGQIITGRDGLLSTPAASNLIRERRAAGGLLLTASHNPGGPNGDFGVKFNTATGGQAPESLTEAIFTASQDITSYRIADLPNLELSRLGTQECGSFAIEVVDSPAHYAGVMERLFDFERMADWLRAGHRICFDALHAVTGPYALEILCRRLGAPTDAVLHAEPLPDFGGFHPDPNPVDAVHLAELAQSPNAPDLIAASDGDGDRNMILGPGLMISPGDSVAVMLAHANKLPGYKDGVPGVARSMPTSRALDAVAVSLGIPCYETPTGWRFFCNLLEADMIGLCGEESFGTGSSHTREKDGLWAVLFWLNLLAAENRSVGEIVATHWREFGRHYYQRQDFFIEDASRATALVEALRESLPGLPGQRVADGSIETADEFCYTDPVDNSESRQQGFRIGFGDGSRVVYRLSGTGTSGATLRVYLERFAADPATHQEPVTEFLAPIATRAAQLAHIEKFTGLSAPTAII
ncbi:MAG: alpha-D-glucose phosphate-specific phosphoglucomutase [Gammaproteobacteria bacterium]|nr:alpha-D-glucose phosphate-specific phosphoglucomutase [Gammaproteobacteria bacterium]